MLHNEFAIGDYVEFNGPTLGVTHEARVSMITLVEALCTHKKYKIETLYLAMSLCDRYLVNLAILNQKAPSLVLLAVTGTLMSAKLEEPMQPNFGRMVRLVQSQWSVTIEKSELFNLEEKIIKSLDFELHFSGPIPFLERYLRMYNLDLASNDEEAFTISVLAHSFCQMVLKSPAYLSLKPS